ncbi:MAG: peptidylprolyl isomerase [Marinobacter sp.]|nr:peptidylprolyl isomerase [Marinobacter sp.]
MQVIGKALLLLLALTMASLAQAERKPLDRIIAVVNDDVILQSEQDSRVRTVASRLNAQGTPLPPRDVLAERVLEQLIIDSIQLQMAANFGMRVSDNELNETMQNIAARNNLSLAQFERELAREGLTYREAREQIRREMLISRLQQRLVDNRVRVTQREVSNFLAAEASRDDGGIEYLLAHILISVNNFNNDAEVAEARAKAERLLSELQAGADFRQVAVAESDASNALEGGVLGWRTGGQLPTLVADVVPGLSVTEPSEILQSGSGFHIVTILDKRGDASRLVEQSRVRHILIRPTDLVSEQRAEERIRDVYRRLQDGEDFAVLARELSDDVVSGSAGGDLGWVNPGQMVPAFEQAMTDARVGQLQGPFRSQFGWHILEVQERRQQDMASEIREAEARQALYRRKFDVELQNWIREIRDEAFVDLKLQPSAASSS